MKRTITLTESELKTIISETIIRVINEDNELNEGWFKNAAIAGAIGAASLFGGQKANAQNFQYQENPYINGQEVVDHQYSQKYDLTYDNEDTKSIIYDLLRNTANYYNNGQGQGIYNPQVAAKVQQYPKYDMKIPIEKFLQQNKALIKRCGGKVGDIDSSVALVCLNNTYYLVPSDIRML